MSYYIEITNNSNSSLDKEKYNISKVNIDDYTIFYTNNYTEGEILIDLKISNMKGPCLNQKRIMKYVLFI